DIFKISLIKPVINELEKLSGKGYEQHQNSMRVIADHIRAAIWLTIDGVAPSNKQQGYVLRRLLRRAIRYAFDLGIEQDLCDKIAPTVLELYKNDFPEVADHESEVLDTFAREEQVFRQTLRSGVREFQKLASAKKYLTSQVIFKLYDTYGFPVELSLEEAFRQGIKVEENWQIGFDKL